MRLRDRGEAIRHFILDHVEQHPSDVVRLVMEKCGISRQAVNRHIQNLIKQGALTGKGSTRSRSYHLAPALRWSSEYTIAPGLGEDLVWREDPCWPGESVSAQSRATAFRLRFIPLARKVAEPPLPALVGLRWKRRSGPCPTFRTGLHIHLKNPLEALRPSHRRALLSRCALFRRLRPLRLAALPSAGRCDPRPAGAARPKHPVEAGQVQSRADTAPDTAGISENGRL